MKNLINNGYVKVSGVGKATKFSIKNSRRKNIIDDYYLKNTINVSKLKSIFILILI